MRLLDGGVIRPYRATREFVREIGAMVILTRQTLVAAVRPPYSYGPELVSQAVFAIRVCWFPMVLASLAFTYGPAGIQAAGFLNLFGALDRLGGLFALTVIREFAPLVCAIVMAGVAGTAITADLGARKIREELDALRVLGVDPVKSLVVPRFLAITALTGLFDIYALLFGTFGGVLVTLSNRAPLGPFFATYFNNATTPELAASLIKTTIFGAMIAIVCCYKGMTASGGPEGVGRAVNQAVVIAFLAIGAIDYVFTQTLLATHPELTLAR
jgi:phospholipid/cholesterol/gamma-HCH transport system permease protein